MELTYNELRKRDVINVSDGRCLGRIIDMRLDFPEGVLVGIVVPGRRVHGLFKLFDKSQLYIDESRIIKIGGDVILVDINCGDLCSSGVRVNKHDRNRRPNCPPPPCPSNNKPQRHSPSCQSPCSPPCPPRKKNNCGHGEEIDFSILSGGDDRIDTGDY